MNTSKNIPGKFLAENCVEMRVSNFAKKHGKEIIPDSREVCKITSTTRHYTYKGGSQREDDHFAYKFGVQYSVWLYRNTDGSFTAHRICDGKKAIFEPGEFKKNELKEEFRVNRKNLRCKTNGAGILILAKA